MHQRTRHDKLIIVIENEEWYTDNKIFKQNIINHSMYGLIRSGMNAWLLQQEHKWMTERQIKYDKRDIGLQKNKLRGFVYSIMNSKFSNSTIKLFRTVISVSMVSLLLFDNLLNCHHPILFIWNVNF